MTNFLEVKKIKIRTTSDSKELDESSRIKISTKSGLQGPKGDAEQVGNLDGGVADSVYGGLAIIDGGDVYGSADPI